MKNQLQFKKLIYGALLVCMCFTVPFACSKEDNCETKTYYLDQDNDNFGNSAESKEACTKPEGNYVLTGGDSDDGDDNVNPNCTNKFYEDADNDGEGDLNTETLACELPLVQGKKYVTNKLDPNDKDANITSTSGGNGGCENKKMFYEDRDEDKYGDPDTGVEACENPDPDKYVEDNTDCDDDDPDKNPGAPQITYYEDNDEDLYGNPDVTQTVDACDDAPEGFVANADDCDDEDGDLNPDTPDVELYPDEDGDGFGDSTAASIMGSLCEEGFVTNNDDCDDTNEDVYPGAPVPENGLTYVIYDCNNRSANADVWLGSDTSFQKVHNVQHTNESGQDRITDQVWFTRHDFDNVAGMYSFVYNYKYWQDAYGNDAEINGNNNCDDLAAAFHLSPGGCNNWVGDHKGSPGRTRWAILEQGGNTDAWESFNRYGKLGNPDKFYSFSNIMTVLHYLAQNADGIGTLTDDNFIPIQNVGVVGYPSYVLDRSEVEGVLLGVYLPDEDIYFTLTFTAISDVTDTLSYTRSTPNN
ncbi:hypothetical protein [Flagellimonas sp.]|uniref:hypothetical protein n=1 Tax=Flagellimonas sp. TaxID=2058762 RepID=UPI003B594240